MAVNRIAYLIAGAALGAAGMALVKEGKGDNLLQNLVQGGHGLTEKLLGTVETIKEDVEDYMAEAKYMHDEKVKQDAEKAKEVKPTAKKKAAPKKKAAAKKAAPKKAATKKAATKKTAAKKAPAKKAAPKKAAAKKAAPKAAAKKKPASA